MDQQLPNPATEYHYPFLNASKWLIILSSIAILVNVGPFIWHIHARNIATGTLTAWAITLNLINFCNAIIWSNDDITNFWHGKIYCDIQVRLIIGALCGGLTSPLISLTMSLARVLDLNRNGKDNSKKRWILDIFLCWVIPLLFMVVYYFVQGGRYMVNGAYGCDAPVDQSWFTIVLLFMWPIIFSLIASYFAGLVIYRLYRYRSQVSSLLEKNKTTRSRFTRLFILALLMIVIVLPLAIAQLALFTGLADFHPYSWDFVHEEWNFALFRTSSMVYANHFDRWAWIALAYVMFLTLGMGSEARKMYQKGLVKMGLARIFPSLDKDGTSTSRGTSSGSTWISSVGSQAKLMFRRSASSKYSDTYTSLSTPRSSKFSRASSKHEYELPIVEPKPTASPTSSRPSKWTLLNFSRMPNFGQAFAGIPPPTALATKRSSSDTKSSPTTTKPPPSPVKTKKDTSSKILITVPSPTIGSLDDDLILQMVGAEPLRKGVIRGAREKREKEKQQQMRRSLEELGYLAEETKA